MDARDLAVSMMMMMNHKPCRPDSVRRSKSTSYRVRAIETRRDDVCGTVTSDSKLWLGLLGIPEFAVWILGSAGVVIRDVAVRYLANDCFQIIASGPN